MHDCEYACPLEHVFVSVFVPCACGRSCQRVLRERVRVCVCCVCVLSFAKLSRLSFRFDTAEINK